MAKLKAWLACASAINGKDAAKKKADAALAAAKARGRVRRVRDAGQAPTVGVIYNPRSHRNLGADFDCGVCPHVHIAQPRERGQLPVALAEFAEKGIDLLVINGGDGTVRDVLTTGQAIFGDDWPAVAVLPRLCQRQPAEAADPVPFGRTATDDDHSEVRIDPVDPAVGVTNLPQQFESGPVGQTQIQQQQVRLAVNAVPVGISRRRGCQHSEPVGGEMVTEQLEGGQVVLADHDQCRVVFLDGQHQSIHPSASTATASSHFSTSQSEGNSSTERASGTRIRWPGPTSLTAISGSQSGPRKRRSRGKRIPKV